MVQIGSTVLTPVGALALALLALPPLAGTAAAQPDHQPGTAPAVDAQPLASFTITRPHPLAGSLPKSEALDYRPRQFAADPYRGWDQLTWRQGEYLSETRPDWLRLTLARPATVVVVWDATGAPPGWLARWTPAPGPGASGPSGGRCRRVR